MPNPAISIVIPTHDRARRLRPAIETSLAQVHPDFQVIVVDDASTDDTPALCARYLDDPRFAYVRLARNLGAPGAKNVGLALNASPAVTFHDSDDQFDPYKLAVQARAMQTPRVADPGLNWARVGRTPGEALHIDLVVCAHQMISLTGGRWTSAAPLSLIDDHLPHIICDPVGAGDWTLINTGLFRRAALHALGGFADSIEEDRELRNRFIDAHRIIQVLRHALVTKVEEPDSLTYDAATGYAAAARFEARMATWARVGSSPAPVLFDAPVEVEALHHHGGLCLDDALPMAPATRDALAAALR